MTDDIAFIGLGTMGFPMAGHLAAAGHRLHLYNRSPARTQNWLARYNSTQDGNAAAKQNNTRRHCPATSPRAAAQKADWVILCVGDDDDLRMAALGPNGVMGGLKLGACLINHGTSSLAATREVEKACADIGVGFLDAPVSGGESGAQEGNLSIFIGGSQTLLTQAQAILTCYACRITRMGEVGCGQVAKMANQICVAGLLQGLAEGLAFAQKAGLDGPKLLEALSQGAAASWQMDHRGATMLKGSFDFGFAVAWMHKDLGFCLDAAAQMGALTPVSAMIHDYYGELIAAGDGHLDSSALIKRLD